MLATFLKIAAGLMVTVYGVEGEMFCGDIGKPVPCQAGAITASGEVFRPFKIASAAIAAPTNMRLKARYIGLRTAKGPCIRIRLNDKMNPRYIGSRGFDLSPKAVRLVTGRWPTNRWSSRLYVCSLNNKPDPVWERPLTIDRGDSRKVTL